MRAECSAGLWCMIPVLHGLCCAVLCWVGRERCLAALEFSVRFFRTIVGGTALLIQRLQLLPNLLCVQVLCGGPQQPAGAHLHRQPDQDAVSDARQLHTAHDRQRGRRDTWQQRIRCWGQQWRSRCWRRWASHKGWGVVSVEADAGAGSTSPRTRCAMLMTLHQQSSSAMPA